jgi:hypothetical protein
VPTEQAQGPELNPNTTKKKKKIFFFESEYFILPPLELKIFEL